MQNKIRWGVIGAGGIAERRTIPGMMLCDNAELVAVMEINMELAEKSRAKWGCRKAYDNEADLLADSEIDAVYIASPVGCHAISDENRDYVIEDIEKQWTKMLRSNTDTFWETQRGADDFENAGSLCHGWAAVPIYIFAKYLNK